MAPLVGRQVMEERSEGNPAVIVALDEEDRDPGLLVRLDHVDVEGQRIPGAGSLWEPHADAPPVGIARAILPYEADRCSEGVVRG